MSYDDQGEEECELILDLGELATALPEATEEEMDKDIEGIPCEVNDPSVLASIERNLGYMPTNLVRVAAYYKNKHGDEEPAVLLLYPLRNCMEDYKKHHRKLAEPFPTIYWLASPELQEHISILEASGLVNEYTDRLTSCKELLHKMKQMHADYATERWNMLTDADRELVEKKRWIRALQIVGIAGIRNAASVKCLHTHYAHYLATKNNLIGEWVHGELEKQLSFNENKKKL